MSKTKKRTWLLCFLKHKLIKRRGAVIKEKVWWRNNSFEYSLTNEGILLKVCKKLILATLNISQMMLGNSLMQGNYVQPKAKVLPHNTTDEHNLELKLLKLYFEKLIAELKSTILVHEWQKPQQMHCVEISFQTGF